MFLTRKKGLIALALLVIGCAVAFFAFRGVVEVTNEDRLVVVNSNFKELAESEPESRISLDQPRVLSTAEVDRIRDLLVPENRHLLSDMFDRPFQIELLFDVQKGRKRLVARETGKFQR